MAECVEIMELQWQELEALLPPKDQQALADHLATCDKCTQFHKQLHFVKDELSKEGLTPLSRQYKMSTQASDRIKARLSQAINEKE